MKACTLEIKVLSTPATGTVTADHDLGMYSSWTNAQICVNKYTHTLPTSATPHKFLNSKSLDPKTILPVNSPGLVIDSHDRARASLPQIVVHAESIEQRLNSEK